MSYVQSHSHIPLILKPATEIVKEAIGSLNATSGGIETYPLCGYLFHSLLLKLTGAQEQKLKCICWEMACRDYDYRYERLERNRYSECSDYKDKNLIYNDLLDEIKKRDETFVVDDVFKDTIVSDWKRTSQQLFDKSLMAICFKKRFEEYQTFIVCVNKKWIMDKTQLLTNKSNLPVPELAATCGNGLKELFEKYVYKKRNRCAHNTRSYQHNLPSLKDMMTEGYKLQNYFLFMSIILLLDSIYVKLFEVYLEKAK